MSFEFQVLLLRPKTIYARTQLETRNFTPETRLPLDISARAR